MNFDPETNYGKPAASYHDDDGLIDMIFLAKFYDPAYTHYGNNSRTNVVCDKCRKSNLQYAMGYLNQDFCLTCYDTIRIRLSNDYNITPPCSYTKQASSNKFTDTKNYNITRQEERTLMETSALNRLVDNNTATPVKPQNAPVTRMEIFSLKRN